MTTAIEKYFIWQEGRTLDGLGCSPEDYLEFLTHMAHEDALRRIMALSEEDSQVYRIAENALFENPEDFA